MVRSLCSFRKLPANAHSVPALLAVMLPRLLLLAEPAHISIDSQADAGAHVAAASEMPMSSSSLSAWACADWPCLCLYGTAICCRGCFSAKAVGQAADLQASLLSHKNRAVQAQVLQLVLSSIAQSAERHWQGQAGQAEALLFDLATVRVTVEAMGPAGHLQVWQTLVPLILPEGARWLLLQTLEFAVSLL